MPNDKSPSPYIAPRERFILSFGPDKLWRVFDRLMRKSLNLVVTNSREVAAHSLSAWIQMLEADEIREHELECVHCGRTSRDCDCLGDPTDAPAWLIAQEQEEMETDYDEPRFNLTTPCYS